MLDQVQNEMERLQVRSPDSYVEDAQRALLRIGLDSESVRKRVREFDL